MHGTYMINYVCNGVSYRVDFFFSMPFDGDISQIDTRRPGVMLSRLSETTRWTGARDLARIIAISGRNALHKKAPLRVYWGVRG